MYLEIIGYTNNYRWLKIKFHEGPLNNRVFKHVSPHMVFPFLLGEKIPFNKSADKLFLKEFKAGNIRLNEESDKELYAELSKFV